MPRQGEKPDSKTQNPDSSSLVVRRNPVAPLESREEITDPREARARGMLTVHYLNLIWLQLRMDWSWLALIAAEPEFSTAELGHSLSVVGARLSGREVNFIEAKNVDLDTGSWLIAQLGTRAGEGSAWQPDPEAGQDQPNWTPLPKKTIVSLENPVANPLALPVALAADGVILCVRRGLTPMSAIRATIDAVGVDRIVCSVLID